MVLAQFFEYFEGQGQGQRSNVNSIEMDRACI